MADSVDTVISNLKTERDRILTAIANSAICPDKNGDGVNVEWVAYRESLFKQLENVQRSLSMFDGPTEYTMETYS